ncbi:MAG: tRNA pseudouridine(38-40) synthase TruA [Nitrospira bacterium HGW-Nitrospira-1]|nr:MAG: tRNA pseudouridine(38-40) synthase TruA [Nitrospira bacterium HGW-Nitrospira-1]
MKYIKLIIEYDGTNYQGWQTQRSGLTIQDTISKTISDITDEQIKLISASRTDAGVHALGQVAAFRTDSVLPADTIKRALNAKLPKDIRILEAEDVDSEFHPRYRALRKSYFYLIEKTQKQSVFLHRYAWRIPVSLDLGSMSRAAAILHGEHDFSAFRGSGCSAKTTVRTIYSITLSGYDSIDFMAAKIHGDFIKIRIKANAFLRHMVRNIIGTLIEVGKGRIAPEKVADILTSCDRKMAGPTAPAKGLFLEKVFYPVRESEKV